MKSNCILFLCRYDSGIYAMMALKYWISPRTLLSAIFQPKDAPRIRAKFANDLVFTQTNTGRKDLISSYHMQVSWYYVLVYVSSLFISIIYSFDCVLIHFLLCMSFFRSKNNTQVASRGSKERLHFCSKCQWKTFCNRDSDIIVFLEYGDLVFVMWHAYERHTCRYYSFPYINITPYD